MQITKGCIVKSMSGHDSGRFYVVMSVDKGFCYIADGKERRLETPKKKNPKHLAPTLKVVDTDELTTNNKLKTLLREYNNDSSGGI